MLTNVNMWRNGKWTKTTAEEAAAFFPYTVSVKQKRFVCELCGQYVTLTGPGSVARHFKHSRGETDKICEERSVNYDTTPLYDNDKSLPIIIKINEKNCSFYIGFPAISDYAIQEMSDEYIYLEYGSNKRVYGIERFSSEYSTYFSVGLELESEYRVGYSNDALREDCGFPEVNEGFVGDGRLFDSHSGKMLPFDSDVSVGRRYYYLTKMHLRQREAPFVRKVMELSNNFKLYELIPTSLDRENAVFFLEIRARLTNSPLKVINLWPPVKVFDDTIIHNQKNILIMLYGNIKLSLNNDLKTPIAKKEEHWSLYKMKFKERRANLLIGRSRVLLNNQYLFSERKIKNEKPTIEIFDDGDNIILDAESNDAPRNNIVRIKSEYDGFAFVQNEIGTRLIDLSAGSMIEIRDVNYGTNIELFVGNELERVYRIQSKSTYSHLDNDECDIYKQLLKTNDERVFVSHAVRGKLSARYNNQKIRSWIRKQGDRLPKDALEILKRGNK